ncbi:hypothetical protein PR048_020488 [Dryococelus australis]|uniref:Uncharacterized protein n=1 Tax=Dryococelus australis TaxID=614101 RepID=A0ABQ9H6E7_9NEOP|nr:hypothetical protein PR048_020488 [Dryococelus australis]
MCGTHLELSKRYALFFRSSPKRTDILKKKLQESSSSHTRLVKCCETHWGISIFSESLPQIIIALEELIESGNDEKDSPEQYYRRVLFIPYIEELISSLKERFATHKKTIQCVQNILPSYAADKDFISVEPAFTFYQEDLKYPSQVILRPEWEMWVLEWQQSDEKNRPKYATEAVKHCHENLFPYINILITILATLSVTTATAD